MSSLQSGRKSELMHFPPISGLSHPLRWNVPFVHEAKEFLDRSEWCTSQAALFSARGGGLSHHSVFAAVGSLSAILLS
jgi:hypothetical protein